LTSTPPSISSLTVGKIADRRPAQLLHEDGRRRRLLVVQSRQPRTTLFLSETVTEQQPQVVVVVLEVAVVQRLCVVRIRAGIQEEPRHRVALRMRRLIRPVLAPTERSRERRKRVITRMQKAGVGIGAFREQQARFRASSASDRSPRDASSTHRALAGFGLIVAVAVDPLRLRGEHIEKPFTMNMLHVVISAADEPKLFAMWDRTAPIQFQ
jgi:hypothetical protein